MPLRLMRLPSSGKVLLVCSDMDGSMAMMVPELSLVQSRKWAEEQGWPEKDPQLHLE